MTIILSKHLNFEKNKALKFKDLFKLQYKNNFYLNKSKVKQFEH